MNEKIKIKSLAIVTFLFFLNVLLYENFIVAK